MRARCGAAGDGKKGGFVAASAARGRRAVVLVVDDAGAAQRKCARVMSSWPCPVAEVVVGTVSPL